MLLMHFQSMLVNICLSCPNKPNKEIYEIGKLTEFGYILVKRGPLMLRETKHGWFWWGKGFWYFPVIYFFPTLSLEYVLESISTSANEKEHWLRIIFMLYVSWLKAKDNQFGEQIYFSILIDIELFMWPWWSMSTIFNKVKGIKIPTQMNIDLNLFKLFRYLQIPLPITCQFYIRLMLTQLHVGTRQKQHSMPEDGLSQHKFQKTFSSPLFYLF